MKNNHRQGVFALWLPMTYAEDFHSRLDFDLAFFCRRQGNAPLQEKCTEGLTMSAAKATARDEH